MATENVSENSTNVDCSVGASQLPTRAISESAREQASKLNPFISLVGMPDTLSQCAQMIDQLGRFVANAADSGDSSFPLMHLFTGAISSAINFELEASHV